MRFSLLKSGIMTLFVASTGVGSAFGGFAEPGVYDPPDGYFGGSYRMVDFDQDARATQIPDGTAISDQYNGWGVVFRPADGSPASQQMFVHHSSEGGWAHDWISPPNTLAIDHSAGWNTPIKVTVEFAEESFLRLPTRVGIVFTDSSWDNPFTLTAFGAAGKVVDTITIDTADRTPWSDDHAEDTFCAVEHDEGIYRVDFGTERKQNFWITGLEVDNLYYNGQLIPEPSPVRDLVYFSTSSGVFVWSSDTQQVQQLSTFPSYELELSPSGEILVGNGGADSAASGVPSSGIFRLDPAGNAVAVSELPADDLEFDEQGVLYASNSEGIFRIEADGTPVQVSANPTSQFAFESGSTVLTTNGSAFASLFGWRTDRIDLTTDTTTPLLTGFGGEDIEVFPDGTVLVSGIGGVFELLPSGANQVFGEFGTFDLERTLSGTTYIGNPAQYGGFSWPEGLYVLPSGATGATRLLEVDINAIEVRTIPEPGTIVLLSMGTLAMVAYGWQKRRRR